MLGKPIRSTGQFSLWRITRHTIDTVEYVDISLVMPGGDKTNRLLKDKGILTSRSAWEFRWFLFKHRLGWK